MFKIFFALLMSSQISFAYDLGGPCSDKVQDPYLAIGEAEKAKDWSKAAELQKQSVRNMCENPYRWYILTHYLLQAKRTGEVVDVFAEMDKREFELNPSEDSVPADVKKYMLSQEFKKTEIGKVVHQNIDRANKRRANYRAIVEKLSDTERPPKNYIAKDVCPFECCTYGEWTVEKSTDLYDQPYGTKKVGRVTKGTVKAITGEVHLSPNPIVVVYDMDPFKKGDILFLLDNVGEGYSHYWYKGEIKDSEFSPHEYCMKPSAKCWAEYIYSETDKNSPRNKSDWWIQVKIDEKKSGWTKESDHFSGSDSCG